MPSQGGQTESAEMDIMEGRMAWETSADAFDVQGEALDLYGRRESGSEEEQWKRSQ